MSQINFGGALDAMKSGHRVARAGWNGKGMWLYLIGAEALQNALKYGFGEYVGEPTVTASIAMKTADNKIVIGWLASQTDMLADDWLIVGDAAAVSAPDPLVQCPVTAMVVNESTMRELEAKAESLSQDARMEAEIQAKRLTAPRVTPADIEANICQEFYFTGGDGVCGATMGLAQVETGSPLELLTFCVLVLRNGFTVTGESACASPENFDAEIGRKIARENAVNKIWPLMGYALKQRLHDQQNPMPVADEPFHPGNTINS